MPLQLSPATPSDVPVFANIYTSSFRDSLISLRMFPRSEEFQRWWTDNSLFEISQRNQTHFIKVTDTDSDSIIGYAIWSGPVENTKEQEVESLETVWPKDAEKELCEDFFGQLAMKRKAWMGKRKHWHLELICTLPEHQGKGVGSMMLRWGIEQADYDGLECYLDASPKGVPIYEHFGFLERDQVVLLDGECTQLIMIRPASDTNLSLFSE